MPKYADLSGVRAKLKRAEEHQQLLKMEFDIWANQAWSRTNNKFHIQRDDSWYTVTCDPPPEPDLRFAVIIGDLVHNLRSALDHLVWQLVIRDGHEPTHVNQFPMYEAEDKFIREVKFRKKEPQNSILYGIDVDGDAWKIIEAAQPYHCVPVYKSRLRIISGLSNMDKHRTLYTHLAFPPDNIKETISWNPEAVLLEEKLNISPLSFKGPLEIARFLFDNQKDPQVRITGALGIIPCFGEPGIEGGVTIPVGGFSDLINIVRKIVDEISRLPQVQDISE